MNWSPLDYVVAAILIGGVAVAYWLGSRISRSRSYRAAIAVALAGAFILVWVNGAVGIIGAENNDANLMFFGVLTIGLVGAVVTRFRPNGMVLAMYAMAGAQVLVAAIALAWQLGRDGAAWPNDVLATTAFFVLVWVVSARLFRAAALR